MCNNNCKYNCKEATGVVEGLSPAVKAFAEELKDSGGKPDYV